MANLIPSVLSDSPPPLDVDLDDSEEVGSGDFRVAPDIGFDFSDLSRDSPDEWTISSPCSVQFEDHKSNTISRARSRNSDEIPCTENITKSTIVHNEYPSLDKIDLLVNSSAHVNDNSAEEMPRWDKESHCALDNSDCPEILKELESIPFPSFDNCDIQLELRTSPEGADDACTSSEFKPIPFSASELAGDAVTVDREVDLNNQCQLSDKTFSEQSDNLTSGCEETSTVLDVRPVSTTDDLMDKPVLHDDAVDDFDDFADFTDFAACPPTTTEAVSTSMSNSVDIPIKTFDSHAKEDIDDFDDFESAIPALSPSSNKPQAESVENRLATIFHVSTKDNVELCEDHELTLCLNTCLDDSSSVWGHLKDLDTSPALSMQWTSSAASRTLLAALCVDSRNILIGQRWNPLLPRYAANLSGVPLEPVIASPEPAPPPTLIAHSRPPPTENVVPAALFDWTGSGLTNPLDFSPSSLLDLDFLIKFDNVSSSPNAASAVWTPDSSVEKEAAIRDRTNELTIKDQNVLSPLDTPSGDLWLQHQLPSTDILLPTPTLPLVGPHLPSNDASIIVNKRNDSAEQKIENTLEWTSTTGVPQMGNLMTISSHFDSIWSGDELNASMTKLSTALDTTMMDRSGVSAEAWRVVESLPDLSFLSARNLLHTANENFTTFHGHARH